jgi:hypothetical protein
MYKCVAEEPAWNPAARMDHYHNSRTPASAEPLGSCPRGWWFLMGRCACVEAPRKIDGSRAYEWCSITPGPAGVRPSMTEKQQQRQLLGPRASATATGGLMAVMPSNHQHHHMSQEQSQQQPANCAVPAATGHPTIVQSCGRAEHRHAGHRSCTIQYYKGPKPTTATVDGCRNGELLAGGGETR